MSVRTRVEEFRDVFIEFARKPVLAITGKGYLGSVLDHTKYISKNILDAEGFVSEAEFSHGIFFSLHEGSGYILMYGMIGIVFMTRFIVDMIRRVRKRVSIPHIIGAYWFVLF